MLEDIMDEWRCGKCGSLSECCFCDEENPTMGDMLRDALEREDEVITSSE
jgi:hypothetical protein